MAPATGAADSRAATLSRRESPGQAGKLGGGSAAPTKQTKSWATRGGRSGIVRGGWERQPPPPTHPAPLPPRRPGRRRRRHQRRAATRAHARSTCDHRDVWRALGTERRVCEPFDGVSGGGGSAREPPRMSGGMWSPVPCDAAALGGGVSVRCGKLLLDLRRFGGAFARCCSAIFVRGGQRSRRGRSSRRTTRPTTTSTTGTDPVRSVAHALRPPSEGSGSGSGWP